MHQIQSANVAVENGGVIILVVVQVYLIKLDINYLIVINSVYYRSRNGIGAATRMINSVSQLGNTE